MGSDAIKPGDIIADKYRVRAILSRSRGFLVEAFHTQSNQRVAVRVLSPTSVDPKEVERFRRESTTLGKLESEHVARLVDVGQTRDGAFFYARQYLEGQDLAATTKQRGPLPLQEAALYVLQAAEAVAECHSHGILLRELQPSHLFLTQGARGAQVRVIDFGTSKLMLDGEPKAPGSEITATSMFGLSCYSSPELVRRSHDVDQRTDVWSLGAILYQLLTARPPFEGEMASLMLAITRDEPVAVTRYRPDLPPEIDQIIGWSLAKDAGGRFANVHAFAHALSAYAPAEGQALVHRIGELTLAGEQRRAQAGARGQAIANPVTVDGGDLIEEDDDDDEPRTAYRPADAPVISPTYQAHAAAAAEPPKAEEEGQSLERTLFIAPGYSPPSPASPEAHAAPRPAAGAGGAPPPASPHWQPMGNLPPLGEPAPAATLAIPSPLADLPPTPPVFPGPPPQSPNAGLGAPRAALATVQSAGIPHAPGGAKPQPKGAKVALIAVAGAVVLLSIVAVVVVLRGRGGDVPATAASASAPPASAAAPASASAAPTAAPSASAAASAAPSASADAGTGTLVAVAIGGTCAFAVNGASKGSAALKLPVKPGTYTVTCKPAKGAAKTKSVKVEAGATATATFKL